MIEEGVGHRAPREVFIPMTRGDVAMLHLIAERRDRFRRYAQRKDPWGRGFVKHPTLCGLMGEHALCVYLRYASLRLSVDQRLLPGGDEGKDLEALGMVIQIKTNLTGNANLIRRIDDRKRLLPLNCDLYVFARSSEKPLGVFLKGWIWARDASKSDFNRIRKSPRAEHWNLQIDPRELEPMHRLLVEVRGRRAA